MDDNTIKNIILELDQYGRNVSSKSYGLPVDPDTKNLNTPHGKAMIKIIRCILNKNDEINMMK